MTAHLHSSYVEGCYRCELGKDEAAAAEAHLRDELATRIWKAPMDKLYIIEAVLDL